MSTDMNALPPGVNRYRVQGAPAVEFAPCEWNENAIVIWSRVTRKEIGILIPTPEGFRLALDEGLNCDLGGGLIVVWNRDPISLRFDVVTTAQEDLNIRSDPAPTG